MKTTAKVLAAYLCVVCGSVLAINHWESLQADPVRHVRPEGYQKPTAHDRMTPDAALRTQREGRVTKLEIAPSVPKYFEEQLELVALAPGSGWVRFKTDDGITPTLSFKKITQGDVQRFNAFARGIRSPIRVDMAGNVLHITAEETEADLAAFKGKGAELASTAKPKAFYAGFNKTDTAPRVVLKKDKQGNIFLVKADDQKDAPVQTVATGQ